MKVVIVTQRGVFRYCECCADVITPRIRHIHVEGEYKGKANVCDQCYADYQIGWSFTKKKATFKKREAA